MLFKKTMLLILILTCFCCETLYADSSYVVHDDKQAMDFAWFWYDRRNFKTAREMALVAMKLNADNVDAYNLLGLIELKDNFFNKSISYLEVGKELIKRKSLPHGDFILCKLGIAYFKNNEYEKAATVFNEAINITESWQPEFGAALSLWNLNDKKSAIKRINKCRSLGATVNDFNNYFIEFSISGTEYLPLIKNMK
ncbi:MAG: tetratricopeptide repeat protein [Candidatus Omnitrophica bacterium]|nr:tetratricopeptide repeat protein [Candidatus Omnitrophota bacterium]